MIKNQRSNQENVMRYQLLQLRFDLKNGRLFNSAVMKKKRKLIAQFLTLRNRKI
ncbi:MAG: 50S ribosomal protein L29 [Deltaproteobacteria bacterium]|nr:MAG: 50S ribosomal protein L29 [Deltaproteobacteria bacterium]